MQAPSAAAISAADDLVGNEHVPDPPMDHRLGLADLLHTHADGAQLDPLQRDDRAFVSLGVRARPDRLSGKRGAVWRSRKPRSAWTLFRRVRLSLDRAAKLDFVSSLSEM